MPVMVIVAFLCVSGILIGVQGHPGRPAIPDNQIAATIFRIAEANRNTTHDGFLSVDEMADIFKNFDANGNHCIDQSEFIAHWTNLKLGELDQAVRLFHHADTDSDGCIEKDPDYDRLFYYFDRNADGKISEIEFQQVWYSLSV